MNDTINKLTNEYQEWAKSKGYPEMSADELLVQTDSDDDYIVSNESDRIYLNDFIVRWESANEL